ncbi:MAG: hypothetical protein HOP22_13875 [Nitrospiraceae bacterium]|nr:hypothetical protein [Nitrospiraceae bacterium]
MTGRAEPDSLNPGKGTRLTIIVRFNLYDHGRLPVCSGQIDCIARKGKTRQRLA